MENIEKEIENIFIIQPIESDNYRVLHEEAISLIESAGGAYAGTIYQNIREINPATYIGMGKLVELNRQLEGLDGITILFNGALSPSQTLNISAALSDRKVIDRTTLILDIFAKNALSGEGKLQVELAQLKYIYPRLKGEGIGLSRLGGGIGTRGPGETQLESDRRLIRQRIKLLSRKIDDLQQRRELQTDRRKKNQAKTIALVGYTNTGKSSLMNLLTDAGVYVQNQLFATLDATARAFTVEGINFILTDTVGFLQDLPHHLIEAFQSTLDSALHCDLALIVCDASAEYEMQLKTTLDTLQSLGFNSPYLVVMNKCDLVGDTSGFPHGCIQISVKEKSGIDELKRRILQAFSNEYRFVRLFIPYEKTAAYNAVRRHVIERDASYADDGQYVDAVLSAAYYEQCKEFIVK